MPPVPDERRPPPIIMFPSIRSLDVPSFFEGLASAGGEVAVVGAAPSGEGGRFFQLGSGAATEGRTATAIVRAGAHVEVAVAQGCRPIGRPAVVTKTAEGAILALASQPAAGFLAAALEAAGLGGRAAAAEPGVFAGIAIDPRKHPLVRGDFLVRPILSVDGDTGAVTVGEHVAVGQTIVFQVRDKEAAAEDLDAVLDDLAGRLAARKPRFALYFDCLGRGKNLYGEPDHDVSRIRARFPGLPFAGFFGNGEIAPVGGKNHLHTYTGVLVVFCDP
jgi:small ligand-binding sensory domain FIST